MALSEEKVAGILEGIVKDNKLDLRISAVVYRPDYQDYFVVVGRVLYCEIREKLFELYGGNKNSDAYREIVFRLKHPVELDEWRKMQYGIEDDEDGIDGSGVNGNKKEEKKIEVDDKESNDWV